MKIIHCADLHIGSRLETNLDRSKANLRRKELILSFERMVSFARENRVRVIIVAGDMFDKDSGVSTAVKTITSVIAAAADTDFLVLPGNHDASNPFEMLASLPENLKLFGDSWQYYRYENVCIGGVRLCRQNNDIIYTSLSFNENDYNIAVMHGDIASEINLAALKNKNIDYLALGHIHEHSEGKIDERGNYAYSGCLESRGFDEGGKKGFYLLETESRETRFVTGLSVRSMYELHLDVTETEGYARLRDAAWSHILAAGVTADDMVKLVLVGNVGVNADIDAELLNGFLSERLFFSKVKDMTAARINPDDYKNDISLRGEFVRQVLSSPLSEEEKKKIIMCGIRAIRGEEIEL